MRRQHYTSLYALVALHVGLLFPNVSAAEAKPAETQAAVQQDNWETVLEAYGWIATIGRLSD